MSDTNDKELLEMAAKAANLHVLWDEQYKCLQMSYKPGYWFEEWNPLTDDGDALRLAVKLDLCVIRETLREPIVSVVTHLGTFNQLTAYRTAWEPLNGEPYAATRRAIVRAAAEIGKAMP